MIADMLLGTIYAASPVSALPNEGLYGSATSSLLTSAWAFDTCLNLSVTVAIAGRLWWIDRTMASLTATRTNRYVSSIYVVVESGAISAAATIVALLLYLTNSPASLTGLDVASQLVVCVDSSFLSFAH